MRMKHFMKKTSSRITETAAAAKPLLVGQYVFLGCMAICTILRPGYAFSGNQGGISNYGTDALTVAPFSIGFLGLAYASYVAAQRLKDLILPASKQLRAVLLTVTVLHLAVLLTTYPYKFSPAHRQWHVCVASLVFLVEIVLAWWLAARIDRTAAGRFFFIGSAAAFGLAAATSLGFVHLLLIAEVLGIACFGLQLWHGVRHHAHTLNSRHETGTA